MAIVDQLQVVDVRLTTPSGSSSRLARLRCDELQAERTVRKLRGGIRHRELLALFGSLHLGGGVAEDVEAADTIGHGQAGCSSA